MRRLLPVATFVIVAALLPTVSAHVQYNCKGVAIDSTGLVAHIITITRTDDLGPDPAFVVKLRDAITGEQLSGQIFFGTDDFILANAPPAAPYSASSSVPVGGFELHGIQAQGGVFAQGHYGAYTIIVAPPFV